MSHLSMFVNGLAHRNRSYYPKLLTPYHTKCQHAFYTYTFCLELSSQVLKNAIAYALLLMNLQEVLAIVSNTLYCNEEQNSVTVHVPRPSFSKFVSSEANLFIPWCCPVDETALWSHRSSNFMLTVLSSTSQRHVINLLLLWHSIVCRFVS